MLGTIKGVLALLVVLIVWTTYLVIPLKGWSRLLAALIAIFKPSTRAETVKAWLRDDVMINEWLGGIKTHTISGRVGYLALKTGKRQYLVMQWVIDRIFWFQPHHCFISVKWSLFPKMDKVNLTKQHYQLCH